MSRQRKLFGDDRMSSWFSGLLRNRQTILWSQTFEPGIAAATGKDKCGLRRKDMIFDRDLFDVFDGGVALRLLK